MISLTRKSAYADKLRAYIVELDGVNIGTIKDGETKTFNAAQGKHTLRLKIDWARSQTITFNSQASQTVHFRCQSNLQGARLLLGIPYIIFMPHRYIKLERIDSAGQVREPELPKKAGDWTTP